MSLCEELKKSKIIELNDFIQNNTMAAPQGSKTWLLERQSIIGGSEMAIIEGCNPYNKLVDLVGQKVGLTSFNGNTPTRWGNLFENVSELLFKVMFDTEIHNTGGIQHKTIKNHKYSPDGLCVMQCDDSYKTILLEFKSPFGTVPTSKVPKHYTSQVKAGLCTIDIADKVIFINNMFRKCSFDQLNFDPIYDNRYHKDTEKKLVGIDDTIANSMILFSISKSKLDKFQKKYTEMVNLRVFGSKDGYVSDSSDSSDSNQSSRCSQSSQDDSISDAETASDVDMDNIYDNGTNILYKIDKIIKTIDEEEFLQTDQLIDFGDENKLLFDQFLELYKPENEDSFIDIKCIKPQINKTFMTHKKKNMILDASLDHIRNPDYLDQICKKYNFKKILNKFIIQCKAKDSIPIGFLPWKLIKSSHIIVERDPMYLDNIKDKIDEAIRITHDIISCSTDDQKVDTLENHFPNNHITKKYYDSKMNYDVISF